LKRTDADGHDANLYTEGNPSLGIPATVVGSEEMNNIQEELALIVEDQGIVLDKTIFNQVLQAIRLMVQGGGLAIADFSLGNNQAAQVVTPLVALDKVLFKGARFQYDIHRRTDTQSLNETGEMFVSHDTENDVWTIFTQSHGDDAETIFSITAAGQVLYTTNNLTGASYSGNLKIISKQTFAQ
jgi:hypothetical protein